MAPEQSTDELRRLYGPFVIVDGDLCLLLGQRTIVGPWFTMTLLGLFLGLLAMFAIEFIRPMWVLFN